MGTCVSFLTNSERNLKRILVLGGSGMLGHKLVHELSSRSDLDVHCTVRRKPAQSFVSENASYHEGVDVEQWEQLRDVLSVVRPDIVINAIGAVKQKNLSDAIAGTFFVNGTLPHLIPLLTAGSIPKVIHFSTDCVFKGDRGNYTERDIPDAEDLYGRSKACGEIAYGSHLTIRTSIIGFELTPGLGLLSWLFTRPRGAEISGYNRAIFSGLPTCTLARTVADLVSVESTPSGLYQVASRPIDKFSLLQRINEEFSLELTIRPSNDVIIDRSLDDKLFRTSTGTSTPDWPELLKELSTDFRSLPYSTVYQDRNVK